MATYGTLRVNIDERQIAVVTLARPEKHNAMNAEMIDDLHQASEAIGSDPEIRAVVLAAEGRSFCAGGDLAWMQETARKDRAGKMQQSLPLANMLKAWDDLPKLVIGRVQGPAYGGGLGLMSVCDVVIAVETARFALTETRLGLIPATIGPYVIRRLGEGAARRAFLHGPVLTAARVAATDLVSEVVPADDLDEAVEAELRRALACAPGAIAEAKALAKDLARGAVADPLQYTAERLADRWENDEAVAGIAAFLDKGKPPWVG